MSRTSIVERKKHVLVSEHLESCHNAWLGRLLFPQAVSRFYCCEKIRLPHLLEGLLIDGLIILSAAPHILDEWAKRLKGSVQSSQKASPSSVPARIFLV